MNKLIIKIHVPECTGGSKITCENILTSKWLTSDQKELLMKQFYPESKVEVYGFKKVADGKKVKVTDTSVYYNEYTDKYVAIEDEYNYADFNIYNNSKTVVTKDETRIKFW